MTRLHTSIKKELADGYMDELVLRLVRMPTNDPNNEGQPEASCNMIDMVAPIQLHPRADDFEIDTPCKACGEIYNTLYMFVCNDCGNAYHPPCCTPEGETVEEDDERLCLWHCPACVSSFQRAPSRLKHLRKHRVPKPKWITRSSPKITRDVVPNEPEEPYRQTLLLCDICGTLEEASWMLKCKRCKEGCHPICANFDEEAIDYDNKWGNWECTSCLKDKRSTGSSSQNKLPSPRNKENFKPNCGRMLPFEERKEFSFFELVFVRNRPVTGQPIKRNVPREGSTYIREMLGPYIIERALENGNCWLANYSDEKPMVSINGKSLKRCDN